MLPTGCERCSRDYGARFEKPSTLEMNDLSELHGARFHARELSSQEGPELQRLFEECADYFDLVLGRPPGTAEAQAAFSAGPETGGDPANKMLFGIRATGGQELIGVMDGHADYPEPGVWYLGLLLFHPSARGGRIGREVVESFAMAARTRGAKELQLNVVEQNAGGYRFWISLGFEEVRRWRQHLGDLDSVFIRMRRPLPL